MANKTVVINKCSQCPYYDYFYYGYHESCQLLSRTIPCFKEASKGIPDDCPLTDAEDEVMFEELILEK